jgi:hypothetical protein
MILSNNFNLSEFTYSATAEKYGIDNTPNETELSHIKELVGEFLQPLRDAWGSGIDVTSGFRCVLLNSHKEIGGSPTSAHVTGWAVDIKPSNGDMTAFQGFVISWAVANFVKFDQIIIEYPKNGVASWIHVGLRNRSGEQRGQIKAIK